jgi:hypothetical protein
MSYANNILTGIPFLPDHAILILIMTVIIRRHDAYLNYLAALPLPLSTGEVSCLAGMIPKSLSALAQGLWKADTLPDITSHYARRPCLWP